MALLLLFTFSIFGANPPIGASAYVPYYAGLLFGMDPANYSYLREIEKSEAVFVFALLKMEMFDEADLSKLNECERPDKEC